MNDAPAWGRFDYRAWRESAAVQLMPWQHRGMYFLLLEVQWRLGYVPRDATHAARLLSVQPPEWESFEEAFSAVTGQFDPVENDPSKMVNPRQARERTRAIHYFEQKRQAGKANKGRQKERTFGRTTSVRPNAPPIDVDVDLETPSVPNGTADENVENWNDVLAPLCRTAGGEAQVGNWLRWCKRQLGHGITLETLEDWIGGFVDLRDTGRLTHIGKGVPCKPAALERLPVGERDQLRKAVR